MNPESFPDLTNSLAAVAQLMVRARDPWWIIGSAAVALHLNRDIGVNDVDILLSPRDARHIRQQLSILPSANASHPLFRSEEYFTWGEQPLPVEFMAGFSVFGQNDWRAVTCDTRQAFMVAGETMYAPQRRELASLLRLFGRPKDEARLALLDGDGFSV